MDCLHLTNTGSIEGFAHIKREGNSVAHSLEKMAEHSIYDSTDASLLPHFVLSIVATEAL